MLSYTHAWLSGDCPIQFVFYYEFMKTKLVYCTRLIFAIVPCHSIYVHCDGYWSNHDHKDTDERIQVATGTEYYTTLDKILYTVIKNLSIHITLPKANKISRGNFASGVTS